LNATANIIQNEGLVALTTKKIADNIGFTEAALYRHFKGKNEVLIGLISLVHSQLNSAISKIDPFLNTVEQYASLLQTIFSFVHQNRQYVCILHAKILFFEPKYTSQSLNLNEMLHQHLEDIIEMGQNEKIFRKDLPSNIISDYILNAIDGEMSKWTACHFNDNLIEKGQLLSDRFLLLIKNQTQ